jgi:nucleotide-binding universal stress UspA family protein
MAPKIIVSYDGTHNEADAIALGRLFADAGGEVAIAYVRHAHEVEPKRESVVQQEAEEILQRGAELLGNPSARRHVVLDRSTPQGLANLAERESADVIVFCSDSHTAKGHIAVGNSAQHLLDGGETAIAIAPVGFAAARPRIERIGVADGDADEGAEETASALAAALGASVVALPRDHVDLIVIGSRAEAPRGQIRLSAASEYLFELARSPVLAVPRAAPIRFRSPATLQVR